MQKKWMSVGFAVCLAAALLLLLSAGCYDPTGPVPEPPKVAPEPVYTQAQVDAAVVVELEEIYSPLPDDWGAPDVCDHIQFLRFRPSDNSTLDASGIVDTGNTDAMLLMVPGILEGANGFEYIGRQLVYIAQTQYDMNIEVWAMDRRNNRLEDLTGSEAAEVSGDAQTAKDLLLGYYYGGEAINGNTFDGWLGEGDLRYLSEFGLKMDTEDMFSIIMTMVPDAEVRKEKVFVGGHSLGGIHTSIFAGWDLDGDAATLDDAGFNNCAGLFAFDSTVTPVNLIVDDYIEAYAPFLPDCIVEVGKDVTWAVYEVALLGMRTGIIPNLVPTELVTGSPIDAEIMAIVEPIGMFAHFAPEGSETGEAVEEIPLSDNMKELLRTFQSANQEHYDDYYSNRAPQVEDFNYTNEAFLGMFFDDDFTHIGMIQTSFGFMQGGAIIPKDEDLGYPGLFVAIDAGPDENHFGEGPLYSWADFDEVANAADPDFNGYLDGEEILYTTMDNEVSSIEDFARALYKGPTNLTEWYFSTRRLVDIMGAIMDYGPCYGLNYLHPDSVLDLPKIEFIAGEC